MIRKATGPLSDGNGIHRTPYDVVTRLHNGTTLTPMTEPHTVDTILAAAEAELRATGIGSFRVRKVSERAGVSPGTVTHYFPTTRDILEALIDTFQKQAWSLWLEHPWSEHGASVHSMVSKLYQLCRDNREVIRARLYLTAQDGCVSKTNWSSSLGPFLQAIDRRAGADKRLVGHSVVLLAMRYAVHPTQELLGICGVDDDESAHEAVRAHLCRIASNADW